VYRYVYQNPIRSGMVHKVCEYPYSTFHSVAGYSKLEVPLTNHFFYEDLGFSFMDEEKWLNEALNDVQLDLIRKGLRRFQFAITDRKRKLLEMLPCKKGSGRV